MGAVLCVRSKCCVSHRVMYGLSRKRF
uniref:Uncharacterized protein n=1 Tax=Anguilla anguilla TaxID=7936 RepID=A0A0E9SUL3_ANGAN